MIPIYKPYLPPESLKYAYEAIDSGWISSLGKYKKLCEELLKEKFGYKYVILVNNGTSATHLVAKVLQFKHPKIEHLYVPNSVYVAAWNAFLFDKNKWKFRCLDVDEETWNQKDKEEYQKNSALLVVHNLGNIYNVPKIKRQFPDLPIVEDNCEGISGKYEGKYSGIESLCSSLSFFANKTITCGEGGAFCTNDQESYEYANLIHGQGQSSIKYIHSLMGNNFRMTNIQAGLLYGQFEIYDKIIDMKKNVFELYREELKNIENISIQKVDENCDHSNWMFCVRVIGNKSYFDIDKFFIKNDIETRPFFYPINYHPYMNDDIIYESNNYNAKMLSKECFMIPSYPELTIKDQRKIIETIKKYSEGV